VVDWKGVDYKKYPLSPYNGRPVGPFFFWCIMFVIGIMAVYVGNRDHNVIMMIAGVVVVIVGAAFSSGTFWICIAGKKDYGDVSDLK
jgi:Na+/melibiose symporter-like transporter